jgi:hypothetical protein
MGVFREFASVWPNLGAVFLLIGVATILPLAVERYYLGWDSIHMMGQTMFLFLLLGAFFRLLTEGSKSTRNSLSIAVIAISIHWHESL